MPPKHEPLVHVRILGKQPDGAPFASRKRRLALIPP